MDDNINKKRLSIAEITLKEINGDLKKLTRRNICRGEARLFSESLVDRLFGSFSAFKEYVLQLMAKDIEVARNNEEDLDLEDEDEIYLGEDDDNEENQEDNLEDNTLSQVDFQSLLAAGFEESPYGYWFNKKTGDYLFDFRTDCNVSTTVLLTKQRISDILATYANIGGSRRSINDVAFIYKMSPYVLRKVLRILKYTHNDLPITSEQLSESSDDTPLVESLEAARKLNIREKLLHKQWTSTEQKAANWDLFVSASLNPFMDFIKNQYTVPVIDLKQAGIEPIKRQPDSYRFDYNLTYIVGLSDMHFGAGANKDMLFYSDSDLTIETTRKAVLNYCKQIADDLNNRRNRPGNCVILSVGDIIHTLTGITSRGTVIDADTLGLSQFKVAHTTLCMLISGLLQLFPEGGISVKSVSGNHDALGDELLFYVLGETFSRTSIKFDICEARWLPFQIGKNAFIMEHGESAKYRNSRTPAKGSPKETAIQKLFLSKTSTVFDNSVKHRYYITGHTHSFNQSEFPGFESITLPAINRGDEYADALGYLSRPAQVCMLVDHEKGLVQTMRMFVDID